MKKIISAILVLTLAFSLFAIYTNAASDEEFLSDIALIYEDSVEDALEEIKGTDWKLLEYDLNPNADYIFDDGVYIIYKTSTNVEDAITDLRVMDMYGGYSVSNYERQLEASRAEYLKMIGNLRIAADEFRQAYIGGDKMAAIAKSQLAVYKDVKTEGGTETGMTMDEFFMAMPSDDQIVQVLFEGNAVVVSNLIALLAIGVSGAGDKTLADRIADNYAIKNTLSDELYYDDAIVLYEAFNSIRAKLLRYDALAAEYNLTDDDITEEEFVFLSEYASISAALKEITLDKTPGASFTLADVIQTGKYTYKDFYPVAAALTEGQMALINMGQLETILKYGAPTASYEDITAYLNEYMAEANKKYDNIFVNGVDVYVGVDRSIFEGTFAMTSAAERQQAISGETWDMGNAVDDSIAAIVVSGIIGGLGAVGVLGVMGFGASIVGAKIAYVVGNWFGFYMTSAWNWFTTAPTLCAPGIIALTVAAAAAILVAAGITGIALWYNYYNPDYTEIPNTMVDIRETDLGDKYIKYTAAKVYKDGALLEKNADFNAYEGKEWIALYYTKDANAGNSLTPKFVHKNNDATIARRHQGISMFGETKAFNLNEHVYSANAPAVYVTVRYSTTKKAAADVPSVVGSMFAKGALYAATALAGAGIGVGATVLIQKAKNKKEEVGTEAVSENNG